MREDIPVKFFFLKINLSKPISLNSIFIKREGLYVVLITQTMMTSPSI